MGWGSVSKPKISKPKLPAPKAVKNPAKPKKVEAVKAPKNPVSKGGKPSASKDKGWDSVTGGERKDKTMSGPFHGQEFSTNDVGHGLRDASTLGYDDKFQETVGLSNKKQQESQAEKERQRKEEMKKTKGVLGKMSKVDQDYIKQNKGAIQDIVNQTKDARNVYQNVQSRMQDLMDRAQREANGAMTLDEAGNVNNKVQQGVRDLYENQAQNVGRRSLQDVGVLNALGSQATAQQIGSSGAPTTGAQLQLLNAGNQQQSGQAYARAQQQMQGLRDQGIDRGFSESANQYNRGQDAINNYGQSIGNYENAFDRNLGREESFRNQRSGYEGLNNSVNQAGNTRNLAYISNNYAGKREDINSQIAMQNALNAQKAQMIGSSVSTVGSLAGGYYGGQAGAQAGGTAGNGISNNGNGGGQVPVQGQGQQPQSYNYYDNRQNPYATQRYTA